MNRDFIYDQTNKNAEAPLGQFAASLCHLNVFVFEASDGHFLNFQTFHRVIDDVNNQKLAQR